MTAVFSPASIVNGEKAIPSNGSYEKLFGSNAAALPDTHYKKIEKLLEFETEHRRRPKALCYEDIKLQVVRHPETVRDTLTMSITFTHHKGSDNRPKPTIFYFTPIKRLIFCLITLIVSIAVLDGAFKASTLTSVEAVFAARIRGPVSYLPLRWKKEWLKRPVFRNCDGDLNSPLPYRTLHDYMGRQLLDMGYENAITPKDWRRNIMRHNNHNNVFQDAYFSAHVQLDVQSAVLGEPAETAVLNMLSHIGHSRDPRASSDMVPDDVWALLPPDPEIEALEQERERLKGGQFRIKGTEHEGAVKRLTALISTRRSAWKKMVQRQYRRYYFQNRPNWDLERQAYGEAPVEDKTPPRDLQLPERAALARLLCDQPDIRGAPPATHSRVLE
ncbi:hypothetical protein EI94DRAFT_1795379 [Lactarius quietus]|nr:hypothetical protein EI94DRAFT_1795379 [Lactarius quietus]